MSYCSKIPKPYVVEMCPHGVMVKATDYRIVQSEHELQSSYYVHLRENTFVKRYEPLYPPSYGLNSSTSVLLGWTWHQIIYIGWYTIKQKKPNQRNHTRCDYGRIRNVFRLLVHIFNLFGNLSNFEEKVLVISTSNLNNVLHSDSCHRNSTHRLSMLQKKLCKIQT